MDAPPPKRFFRPYSVLGRYSAILLARIMAGVI